MRNSPLAKTPPAHLATIPDIINEEVSMDLPPQKAPDPNPKRMQVCSNSKNNEGELEGVVVRSDFKCRFVNSL